MSYERIKRRNKKKKIFEVIMAENCLKFIRDTKNHTSRKFRHNKEEQRPKNVHLHISYSNDRKPKAKRKS